MSVREAEEGESESECHLLPRKETGLLDFLRHNPSFDGRNVLIAIMDTGVDPAAPGLQVTTEGKPKILDLMDCSGSGDVATTVVKTKAMDGTVKGLSGRILRIPSSWKNPSGKFNLGLKSVFELYPKPLKDRIKILRKEKLWDCKHRLMQADAHRQLDEHEKEYGSAIEKLGDRWRREELSSQLCILKSLEKEFCDHGPSVDCIVFHDGSTWRACLDTTFTGDLEKCALLANFREEYRYSTFSQDDLLSYSVNIHKEGTLLEVVTTSEAHGTHVASIASACFPEDPSKNGAAPGAQIVSLCIGDQRLGIMETGSAITRALNRCREMGVNLINYSYGEATHWPNSGRIIQAINETVYKHGILFVSSAGNNGPGLSSGGCPGSTSSACLDMMRILYSLREKLPPMLYPWSARGPTCDGDLGVSVSAPGGAITSVPRWTLKRCQLQNGTSMSSPNAAGTIACLISAAKHNGIPFTPYSIRLALENTAKRTEDHDVFSIGHGLLQLEEGVLQVEEAWRHIERQRGVVEVGLVGYKVSVDGKGRGVYLRELYQQSRPREFTISVEPVFAEDSENEVKVNFFKHMSIRCEAKWVEHPASLELMNQQRQFHLKVDTSSLQKGMVHFTELEGYVEEAESVGPLWRIPVTVIVADRVGDEVKWSMEWKNVECGPTNCYRSFIHVPEGAAWAVKVQSHDTEKFNRFVFHSVQILPQQSYRSHECYKMITLSVNGDYTQGLEVVGGQTLELCITKWWTSLGHSVISYSIHFHALNPSEPTLHMLSSEGIKTIEVGCPLGYEEMAPLVTLKHLCQPIKPMSAELGPLGVRDLFDEGRQIYQLVLSYQFSMGKACDVTALFPPISDYLYESEFDSQLWMIFNSNKQFIAAGEAYPTRYVSKLEKGEFRLMLQLRHEDVGVLEKFRDLVAVVQFRLEKPLSLDTYASYPHAFHGVKKFPPTHLSPGQRIPLSIAALPDDKIPKQAGTGWYLSGAMTLGKEDLARKVSQFPFNYVLVSSNGKSRGTSTNNTKTKADKKPGSLRETLRDVKIGWISRVGRREGDSVYSELLEEFPDHLPLLQSRLKKLCEKMGKSDREAIVGVANEILKRIDQDELLKYFGAKQDLSDHPQNKLEMEKKKQLLIEALAAKGVAYTDIYMRRKLPEVAQVFGDSTPVSLGSPHKKSDSSGDLNKTVTEDSATSIDFQIVDSTQSTESEDENKNEAKVAVAEEGEGEGGGGGGGGDWAENGAANLVRFKLAELDVIYTDILKWADPTDSKVIMFSAKYAACRSHFGRSLKFVLKAMDEKPSKCLDQICIALCEKLGWTHVVQFMTDAMLIKYPLGFRPF